MLPFTTEQFLAVFESYNRSIWPLQFGLVGVAVLLIALAVRKTRFSDRMIGGGLALLWMWMGLAYHLLRFSRINPAAYTFGAAMIIQATLFLFAGTSRSRLSFRASWDAFGITGGLLMLYGLVVYPLLGTLLGHTYPRLPTFGVPCPTTIFTFGLLLWTERAVPKYLLVIPLLWTVIGSSAAWLLGFWEDLGLLVAGILSGGMIVYRDRRTVGGR
jgi:hypothetical protein